MWQRREKEAGVRVTITPHFPRPHKRILVRITPTIETMKRSFQGVPKTTFKKARSTKRGGAIQRVAVVGERKFFDTTRTSFAPAVTGDIANLSLNLIPQGVTESERVGRKCTITKVMLRGRIDMNTTAVAADTATIMRLIIYEDKQANGQTATVTDILETATEASFNNLSNSQRFRILMDSRMPTQCPSGSGRGSTDTLSYGENVVPIFFAKDVKIPIEFSSTAGVIGEIRSSNIGVLAIQSQALANLSYVARVRYSDG